MTTKLQDIVKHHAPIDMDSDSLDYLASVLMEDDASTDPLDIIQQFMEGDAAVKLANSLKEFREDEERRKQHEVVASVQSTTLNKTSESRQKNPDSCNESTEAAATLSIPSTATDSQSSARLNKSQLRKQRREEKKSKRRQQRKTQASADHEDFVDDDVSAWKDVSLNNQSWGGRGYGGRGIRGDVNTSQNIHLANVTLQFAGRELLQSTTIQINGGHRYGLVGRNGCGKSTLLRRIAQHAIPGIPHDLRILLVQQQVEGGAESALNTLLKSDQNRTELLARQNQLETLLESIDATETKSEDLEDIVTQLSNVSDALDHAMGAHQAEQKAQEILQGLQFSEAMMHQATETLSGGWRMRLALAQALFVPSDLLLLDEPTNHLDLHALLWLTKYLTSQNHTLLVVSHDRSFLDICTDIVVMEHEQLHYHPGNYSDYELHREEKAAHHAHILDASARQRAKAMAFVEKQQQKAAKSADPNKQRQAKMIREKKLDRIGNYREDGKRYKNFSLKQMDMNSARLAQKVNLQADEPVVHMKFPTPPFVGASASASLIELEDVSFGYSKEDSNSPLLNHATLQLTQQSKVAVVGRNGSGKSTLLDLIAGKVKEQSRDYYLSGNIWTHPNLRIGHVGQYSVEALEECGHETVVEYAERVLLSSNKDQDVSDNIRKHSGNIRQYLGAFGLGGNRHAHRLISKLSGGERMRLCFATVMAAAPSLLVLDEPTNHLDLETMDSLSNALDKYQGAVLIVSHNQRFLSGFCNELWVVESGRIEVRRSVQSGEEKGTPGSNGFEEIFAHYRSETMALVGSRSTKRQQRTALAKASKLQSNGSKRTTGLF